MVSHVINNVDKIRFNHGIQSSGTKTKELISISSEPETYIIFDPLSRLSKIGRSTNYKYRVMKINTDNSTSIVLIVLIKKDVENLLHKKYLKYRVFGEWFYLSDRVLNEIKTEWSSEK